VSVVVADITISVSAYDPITRALIG